MNLNIAHIAIDLHSNRSVIGHMNNEGKYLQQHEFPTTAKQLISQVVAIPARTKQLTIEQGNMTHWAASQSRTLIPLLSVIPPVTISFTKLEIKTIT